MPTNPAKNASQLRSNCCAYMITQITVTLQLVQGYRGMWTAQKQDGSPARQQCYEKCLKTHLFHNVFPSQTDCTQPSSMTSWILTSFQIFALILYSFVTFYFGVVCYTKLATCQLLNACYKPVYHKVLYHMGCPISLDLAMAAVTTKPSLTHQLTNLSACHT